MHYNAFCLAVCPWDWVNFHDDDDDNYDDDNDDNENKLEDNYTHFADNDACIMHFV
jgi:hypothetical protein